MTRTLARSGVAGAAVASLLAAALVSAPSASADVFVPDETGLSTYLSAYPGYLEDTGDCVLDATQDERADTLTENGPTATSEVTLTGTLSTPESTPRTSEIDLELTGSAQLRSTGDRPRRMTVKAAGSYSYTGEAVEACAPAFSAESDLDSQFTVTEPTLMTIQADASGLDGHIDVQELVPDPDTDGGFAQTPRSTILDLEYLTSRNQTQVELPPGRWDVEVHADLDTHGDEDDALQPVDAELGVDVRFSRPGERQQLLGAGDRWMTMPAFRSCEADTVTPSLTTDADDADAVRRIELYVDGRKVVAQREPEAGQQFPLALRRLSPATVRAFVVLDPLKKGAPTRQRTVTATYQNCFR